MRSYRYQRGMTLFELMIVIVVLAVIVLGVGAGCSLIFSGDSVKEDAEQSARKYAAEMNIKVDGVSCGNRANSKGQVYCSLNSGGKIIPLSCIGRYKVGSGCMPRTVTAPEAETQ